jgi:hypothetical protein
VACSLGISSCTTTDVISSGVCYFIFCRQAPIASSQSVVSSWSALNMAIILRWTVIMALFHPAGIPSSVASSVLFLWYDAVMTMQSSIQFHFWHQNVRY